MLTITEAVYLTEQLKTTRFSYIIISKKNIVLKALLYLNKALLGNFLNRVLAHLIIRTTQRVSTGLTVSRKMPVTKPLGAKIDKLCSLVL